MAEASPTTCEQCGAPIAREDLAQGLAVKLDGKLTCADCIDALPGAAVVRINRLRALRGLGATTYSMPLPRHGDRTVFTFTTAAQFASHRRHLHAGQAFPTPPLPRTPAARAAATAPRERPRGPLLASAAGGALVVIAAILAWRLHRAPAAEPSVAPGVAERAAPPARTRIDLPVDPAAAWTVAETDPAVDGELRRTVADELIAAREADLQRAEASLAGGDAAAARAALADATLPDHVWFRATRARADALRTQLADATAAPVAHKPRASTHHDATRVAATDATAAAPSPVTPAKPTVASDATTLATADATQAARPAATAPAAPIAPAPAPPAAPTTSGAESWLIAGRELWSPAKRDEWRRSAAGAKLIRDAGELATSLDLGGGRYQAWVEAHGPADGFLVLTLAGKASEPLGASAPRVGRWRRFALVDAPVAAGSIPLRLVASGKGWQVDRVWLAGVDAPPPAGDAPPVATGATRFTPVPPAPPAPALEAWEPRFVGPGAELDAYDERAHVPALPGGCERVFASAMNKARKRQALTLDLKEVDATGGGLVVVVHPQRADRAKLTAIVEDLDGHRWQGVVDVTEDWDAVAIDLRDAGLAADRLKTLTLEDVEPNLTTAFLLAGMSAAINQPATPALVPLRPPALILAAPRALDEQMAVIAAKRRWRAWRKDLDPAKVKLLVGPQLGRDWDSQVAKALKETMGLREDQPLPARTIEPLVMQDLWLNALFDGAEPAVDRERHHVVLIATAGIEFPIGMSEPQAFLNFWKKAIDVCLDHAVLPVVVLGPSKVDPAAQVDAERLWQDVELYVRTKRPGVPMIDLRAARARDFRHFLPGQTQLAAELLGDGYHALAGRIRWLQKNAK